MGKEEKTTDLSDLTLEQLNWELSIAAWNQAIAELNKTIDALGGASRAIRELKYYISESSGRNRHAD